MESKKLRVSMIGCGMIAERLHIPDYFACPQAELVAFCDINISRAKLMAEKFAPGASLYTDYNEMLQKEKPDCVTVATPNFVHAPATIAALQAGANVLVEKPMATSSEEAQAMLDAAKKAGKVLMVNQSQRRFPPHRKAKEILDSGIMGKILHITAMFGHMGPEYWSPTGKWFFKKAEARFGAMADLGVHKADLVRYLSGKEVDEISAYTVRLEKKRSDVEDNFVSCMKFTDGTVGTLCASWTVKGMEANYTIFHCANGTLRVCELPGAPLVAKLINPACEINFDAAPPVTNEGGSAWGLDVSGAFVRACLGLEEPYCSGEEGKRSLEVVLAAEESALSGKSIKLKH